MSKNSQEFKISPGNYWLITAGGNRRKAIVTEDNLILLHQEAVYSYGEYRGVRWWQPPYIDSSWSFVPRVEDE